MDKREEIERAKRIVARAGMKAIPTKKVREDDDYTDSQIAKALEVVANSGATIRKMTDEEMALKVAKDHGYKAVKVRNTDNDTNSDTRKTFRPTNTKPEKKEKEKFTDWYTNNAARFCNTDSMK